MRTLLKFEPRLRFFIGDVRDRSRLTRAMHGVDIVIHAAALKRVEVAEYDAEECAKTNVGGTVNVIAAATDAHVERVVLLSTDKACSPVNAYGASKLLAEKVMLAANNARGSDGPIFAVTRYGNVAGSRGSVIPTWREAHKSGHRLQLTNPDMTRYWMTMDEAVELVAWTVEHMTGGELVVPELPAYRLADLAEAIGGEWDVVGYRHGEKLHEAMIGIDELHDFGREGKYFVKRLNATPADRLGVPQTSDGARRLNVEEIRSLLARVA